MNELDPSPARMMQVMTSLLSELEQLTSMKDRFANMEEALVDSMERLDDAQARLENQAHACKALYDKLNALAGLVAVKLPPMLPHEKPIKPEPIPR